MTSEVTVPEIRSEYVNLSCLYSACVANDLQEVQTLVNSGADVYEKVTIVDKIVGEADKFYTNTPMEIAIIRGKDAIVYAMLQGGADPNFRNEANIPMLKLAVVVNESATVLALLQSGAEPNDGDETICSMLHIAVIRGSVDIVRHLIDFKVDTSVTDNNGKTAMAYGTHINKLKKNANHTAIVKMLEKEHKSRQKCVAFAMGHHKRLGIVSLVVEFPPEILRMVIAAV